jgi:hypothetical protein
MYRAVEKLVSPKPDHMQLLTGSETVIFGLLVDSEIDQRLLGSDRQKKPVFLDVSILYVENRDIMQRFVVFHYGLKEHGYKLIHTRPVAGNGSAYTEGSVKYWVCEYNSGRRDYADLSKTGRPPSDIAEALSKVLNGRPFSGARYIAAQFQTTGELAKGTLAEVLGMKKIQFAIGLS